MSIISEWMREHRITEVECITPDFTGIARGKIIPKEKFDKEDFRTKNYSYLIHSDLDAIVDYIEEEINTYVEKILIGIEDNTKEDIEAYTLLLNNSKLELRLKEKLIEKIDTIIDDIATIDGSNETHLLFKYSKVKQTWENIESIFNKDNSR